MVAVAACSDRQPWVLAVALSFAYWPVARNLLRFLYSVARDSLVRVVDRLPAAAVVVQLVYSPLPRCWVWLALVFVELPCARRAAALPPVAGLDVPAAAVAAIAASG